MSTPPDENTDSPTPTVDPAAAGPEGESLPAPPADTAPSSGERPWGKTESRVLWAVFLGAFVLRAAGLYLYPIDPEGGDQKWFLTVARNLAQHGVFSDAAAAPFAVTAVRPPGLPIVLAPFYLVFGDHARLPISIFLSAVSAAGVVCIAYLARHLFPKIRALPVASAVLLALSPYEMKIARAVIVEPIFTTAFLFYLLLCMRATEHLRRRTLVGAAFVGAFLVLLRLDALAIVLVPPVACPLLALVRGKWPLRRTVIPFGALGVGVVALCLPWSLYLSSQLHQRTFVASSTPVAEENGITHWMSATYLPEPVWWSTKLRYHHGWVRPDELPSSVFRSPEEEAAVRDALTRVWNAGKMTDEANATLDRLTEERRADVFRTFVLLPLHRSFDLWFDFGKNQLHYRPRFDNVRNPLVRYALEGWTFLYAVFFALGFVVSIAAATRLRHAFALPAILVLVRTYSILLVGVMKRHALFEVRYLVAVHPLALMFFAAALLALLAARKGGLASAARLLFSTGP